MSGANHNHSALIDSIRGLAAIQVVISHSVTSNMVFWGNGFGAVTGVYLFFILSGYLIWSSAKRVLARDGGLYVYAVHRVARIAPLYYLALLAAVTIFPRLVYYHQDITTTAILRHIFFTQTLLPVDYAAINPLLWTLTLEVLFYILVPVLFLIGRGRLFFLIPLLAVGMYAFNRYDETTFVYFFGLFYLFAIGMTLEQFPELVSWPLALVSAVVGAGLWISGVNYHLTSTVVAVAMFVCILTAKRAQGTWPFRALAFVGLISYSLYVWHYMLIDAIATPLVPYVSSPWGRMPILIGASIVFAWASYRLIEAPAQNAIRSWLLSKPPGHPPQRAAHHVHR